MSERGSRRALAVVLGVAFLWRLAFLTSIEGTPLTRLHAWPESDMATFVEQARRIAAGDWLAESPYYPYHLWMKGVSLAEWEAWRPVGGFYQPPLYSFALAGLMGLGADAAAWARWVQLVLGVWACGLIFGIGARLFGTRTGLVAGLIVGLYGPLLMAESQLLRDGPILFSTCLILWVAVGAMEGGRKRGLTAQELRWRAWLLGLLIGAQMMLHESAVFFGLAVMAIGAASQSSKRRIEWAFLIIGGMAIGYGPMLARNIAVGAPLGPGYFGSAQAFAVANHPDNETSRMSATVPERPERFVALMREAQGRPLAVVGGVARQWGDEWPRWLKRWGMRVVTLLLGGEVAENLSYAYFKRRVPVLSLAFDFRWVLPAALAGAVALGWRRWRAKLRGGLGLVALQGLMAMAMVSAVYPFGRYRLMFLPLLALLAAYGVGEIGRAWRRGRRGRLATLLAIAVCAAAGQYALGKTAPFAQFLAPRATEYLLVSRDFARQGRLEAAILELEDGLEAVPGNRQVAAELALTRGLALQGAARYDEAAGEYREALRLAPENPLAQAGLKTAMENQPLALE